MKRFLPVTLMAVFAVTAAAQQGAPPPMPDRGMPETVTVSGSGRVRLTPDRYSFTVGVQTVAATVDEAVNENSRRMKLVTDALRKAGALDPEIRTSNFSISPQQDYRQGQLPQILGYQVNNNVTVQRKNAGDAGRLLQAAVNAGVNTSSGLQFEVSDPLRGRDAGLHAAFEDARSKAMVLAQAAGRGLGRALVINESGVPEPPRPYPMRAMALEAKASVPVEEGSEETSYGVSVTFELR